ncbi:MAG: hypothetical protein RIM33_07685 [Alphaproteobacteria bacterium]
MSVAEPSDTGNTPVHCFLHIMSNPDHTCILGNDALHRGGTREVLFFISPRIIDFDAFLPTAMQMKADRPDWRIRFVTFSRENFDFIATNGTHVEALKRTGTLHYLGWEEGASKPARLMLRLVAILRVILWILRFGRPVLILGLPFTAEPYAIWRAVARLRAGNAVTLWKYRSPDIALHRFRKVRKEPPKGHPRSLVARLFAKDADLFVHYHDQEETNIEWARPYGRLDNIQEILIGMPHYLPAWRKLIADQVARARADFEAEGFAPDTEYFTTFPAKVWSAESLRDDDAIVWTFELACRLILAHRPKGVILMRPHPKAAETPYYLETLEQAGPSRARISMLHPEVLLELAHRAVFNNPTNILFSCFTGRMIDNSDYHPEHYEEFGDRSLADGYGPVYINPRAKDFEDRFLRALDDDALFDDPDLVANRDALLSRNPADITRFISWVENAPSYSDIRGFESENAVS